MAAVEGQATQLDFHQAMEDFKTMFPDVDADVIEAVLRANQGAVHETIDQLLTMTTDTEGQSESVGSQLCPQGVGGGASNELPPSYALSATPPPSYHQAVPSPHRSPLKDIKVGQVPVFDIALIYSRVLGIQSVRDINLKDLLN
ncbi:CUE domain-containing protein 1-like 2 [Homarus americanus]|uniref:CUE domain-containing protein 1-like 2 n=1 Tax=Homarus americanus TaxID=6706 RepID=A0A8J5N796_HOMAM|nr:CUE domain-containing protein 1-like 2 [Homarus americanus]